MNISINFGGFYGSIHESIIDNLIKGYELDQDNIDYPKTFDNYITAYCGFLTDDIFYKYTVDIEFYDLKLDSPKYYNYSTDVILANTKKDQVNDLNNKLLKDSDFIAYLKDSTKSYSGYISFYTFDQAINDKDNILINFVLSYICKNIEYFDFDFALVELAKV
jgi:hypothetical protein